jgi:hypothetical protein
LEFQSWLQGLGAECKSIVNPTGHHKAEPDRGQRSETNRVVVDRLKGDHSELSRFPKADGKGEERGPVALNERFGDRVMSAILDGLENRESVVHPA